MEAGVVDDNSFDKPAISSLISLTSRQSETRRLVLDKNTAAQTLDNLAEGASTSIQLQIAAHENCSVSLIKVLVTSPDEDIRCAIASRKDIGEELVWMLTCDSSPKVRCRLAANPELPTFALEALAEDEHAAVSARAERTLARKVNGAHFDKVMHWFLPNELKKTG